MQTLLSLSINSQRSNASRLKFQEELEQLNVTSVIVIDNLASRTNAARLYL